MTGFSDFKIFNPQGTDSLESRKVWKGDSTRLCNLNNIAYPWAYQIWKQMREQFWVAEKVDTTSDVTDYTNLTEAERKAYDGVLSYLTFLDSVQTENLPFVKTPITAPEVSIALGEQLSQETLHNQSYQVLIENIIPSDRRNQVYDFWREDKVLKERCGFIASLYQQYIDDKTEENYFISLVADYLLEGLYFFNGFTFFYNLASRQLMPGSADMIKLINRDELSHKRLFQKLLQEGMKTFPHSQEQILEMTDKAVNQEILWTNHIIGDEILGITSQTTEAYSKYLGNKLLKAIGLPTLYEEVKNPYKHLEQFADLEDEASTKGNFFEASVTSYNMFQSLKGWDF